MSEITLPEPLVSPEVELRDFAFMPLEVNRLRRSKAWLKAKRNPALAFYMINLWTASWHDQPAGSLEDDEDVLADLAMCDPSKWSKFRNDVLHGWIKCADGRLYNPTVCEKVRESWTAKQDRREREEHERDRKRREREDRARMFEILREAGQSAPWNIKTYDLRELVTNLSRGQERDSHGELPDESRLREGQGEGEGEGQGEGQGECKPSVPEPAEADHPAEQKSVPAAKAAGPKKSDGDQNETELQAACRETLRSYASAYWDRYQTEPVVNAKVRSQIKQFCQRLAHDEAPQVAAFYVTHQSSYYVRKCHDIGGMLSDAEKLRTEWATNRQVTGFQANQADRTQSNMNAADEAMRILEAQGEA